MARLSGRSSTWGAFLDSTLDRFGDAAVFGGLLLYFAGAPDGHIGAAAALACLTFSFVTSYARARAEGLQVRSADVGALRSEPTGCSLRSRRLAFLACLAGRTQC